MPSLARIVDPLHLVGRTTRLVATTTSVGAQATADAGLALLARALATQTALDAVDAVLRSPAAQRAVRTAIGGPLPELAARAAVHERVLESEGVEQLVVQALDSHLADASVAHLLAGRNLWLVVEEIASSPMVAKAIAQQGAGFADQVADEVGQRTRRADDRVERAARRLLHRRPPPEAAGGPFSPPRPP
jgi:hypothetical protein